MISVLMTIYVVGCVYPFMFASLKCDELVMEYDHLHGFLNLVCKLSIDFFFCYFLLCFVDQANTVDRQ